MARTLASPFLGIAVAGLALSLFVHVTALLGLPNPLGRAAWALHVGIFVVWIPAVIFTQPMNRSTAGSDSWRAALRGCPPWMRYMTYGFFGYALVNFALFLLLSSGGVEDEASKLRGFSGHWMCFYSGAVAMLYSYLHVDEAVARCINGHVAEPNARYCAQCGQPVRTAPRIGEGERP